MARHTLHRTAREIHSSPTDRMLRLAMHRNVLLGNYGAHPIFRRRSAFGQAAMTFFERVSFAWRNRR